MNRNILFLCSCRCKPRASPEEFALIQEISSQIKERQNAFFDMEAYLPKRNGYVLRREAEALQEFWIFKCSQRFVPKGKGAC